MARITGDSYLARTLSGYGVTHFFHGPLIVPRSMREMERPEHGVQPVSVHSEKAAGYMADGYARATGRPGICGSQGIGRSNLLAGLRDAYMARSPIVALTGGSTDEYRYRGAYQEVDDERAFDPVTKFNARVDQLDRLPDLLRQAFREATSGCPAPTHLALAGLIGNVSMDEMDDDDCVEPRFSSIPAFRPAAEPDDVAAVLAALAAAERPVIVAGGGVVSSGAQSALRDFASRHQIPVATSLNAKGSILDDDPLSVGVIGLYSRETANRVAHEADLVFYVGSLTGGQVTNHWKTPASGTDVIQLDIDPHGIGRNYPNVASVCGDARVVLRQLLNASGPIEPKTAWLERVATINDDWTTQTASLRNSDTAPLRPERLLDQLSDYLPDDAVFVCDTGHAGMWAAQYLRLTSPNQTFIRAAGSLGWGFPAALGAKCGQPDRPVFAFTGDGGYYYHFSELETAVRYGINTVTIINNNFSLNQETPVWRSSGDGVNFDHHWKFGDIDFAKIATEMGAFGVRVTDPNDLTAALDEAVASGLPAIVEVLTDPTAMAPNHWTPEPKSFLLDTAGDS